MKNTVGAALVALLLQVPALSAQQAQKASVAGIVLNANGEALQNIRVTLGKLGVDLRPLSRLAGERERTLSAESVEEVVAAMAGPQGLAAEGPAQAAAVNAIPVDGIEEVTISPAGILSVVYKSRPPVMTDDRGRFSFAAVDPGSYRLTFSGNGYVKQDYGQRTIGAGEVTMTLAAGQAKADIVMHMVKLGAVTGQIRDAAGQSVVGVPVELLRLTYDATGQKKFQAVAVTRTDDLGEYRMYALLPGRYYVSAGGQAGMPETAARLPPGLRDRIYGGGYSTPNRIPQYYAQMYYPGTANPGSATAIDVQSGADVRGVDLLVSLLPPYRVRGRVVDPKTGQPPPRVGLVLKFRDSGDKGTVDLLTRINPNYNAADGSFELQNINAGAYFLGANIPDARPEARPMAFASINVNADVNGLVLALDVGGSLNGRLRVESDAGASARSSFNFARVQLKNAAEVRIPSEFEPQPSPVAADGKFHIDNVRSGDYRVSIEQMPEGFYLKEVRLGETDLLHTPLHYSLTDTAVLDVLISPRVGAIDGTALDASGQPLPGAQVVLIPNSDRERTELFRPVTADIAGRFTIPAVAPGDYTIAAWEMPESYSFFDPNLIRQAEGQGKAIRVAESSSQTVNITSIQ